jgi:hypothetical protein
MLPGTCVPDGVVPSSEEVLTPPTDEAPPGSPGGGERNRDG